jgi:hypothetical protein
MHWGDGSVMAAIFIFYPMPVRLLDYNLDCRSGPLCPEQ